MSLTLDQKIARVRAMATYVSGEWILSVTDQNALRWLLQDYDRLRADRSRGSLLRALMDELPPEGTEWSVDERAVWLRLAVEVFNAVYGQAGTILVAVESKRFDEANPSPTGRVSTTKANTEKTHVE